jgi:hypothetical protein
MKILRILALIALISSSYEIFAMDNQPAAAADLSAQHKSPPKAEPNEWVQLTKKLIALSAGAYVGYKLVSQKLVMDKFIEFVKANDPSAPIADVMKVATFVGYGTRTISGLLTYFIAKQILK